MMISRLILLCTSALFFSFSVVLAQPSSPIDSLQEIQNQSSLHTVSSTDSIGSPVIHDDDTLFFVKHSLGTISIKQRARLITEDLEEIQTTFDIKTDSVFLQMVGNVGNIMLNDKVILQVLDQDAKLENTTSAALGSLWANRINTSLKSSRSGIETMLQYVFSIVIFLAFVFLLNYILKLLFRKVNAFVHGHKDAYLKGIRFKGFEFIDAKGELELVLKLVLVIRFLFLLLLAYVTFPIFFRFFPATEPVAYQLIGFIYNPLVSIGWAFLAYVPNIFSIAIIVYIFRVILKYLGLFAERVESGKLHITGFYPEWANTTYTLIRLLVIALGVIMVFPYLPGAQSDVFKGVTVFVGIIFSIGSTSVVGNLVAGLVLTYMRPFRIGDRIKIGDVEGEITEKTSFILRIKTPKNEYITIPNANVLNSHIVNYNKSFDEGGIILFTDITIGYDVPWRLVHDLLLKAADQTDLLEKKPKPFVLQKSLDDFSVHYQINAYSKKPLHKDLIYSLINQNIQDIFAEAGVEILSPNYMAQRDGNASTIPVDPKMTNGSKPPMESKPMKPDSPDNPETPK